jgi:hypothetical protein
MSSQSDLEPSLSFTQPVGQPTASGRVEAQLPRNEDSQLYTPLPPGHIRFLILDPGSDLDAVSIAIGHFDLNNPPKFAEFLEALSYTWGKPTPSQIVYCRGENHGRLSVSPNLHDALVALRLEHHSRFLWIDQICINQTDNEEKSVQVQLMGQIYSKASRVLIWLSKEVFLCQDLDNHFNTILKLWDKLIAECGSSRSEGESQQTINNVSEVSEECWATIKLVFGHPYFTRIWMVQEVVMARECSVVVRKGLIDWRFIEWIGNFLQQGKESWGRFPLSPEMRKNTRCLQKMLTIRGRLRAPTWETPERWCLLDLARKVWMFEATEQRDKVYALLGLLSFENHCIPQDLIPDYTAAASYQQLIWKATVTAYTKEACLISLLHCHPGSKVSLPSWVLDVEDNSASWTRYLFGSKYYSFGASGESSSGVQPVINDVFPLSFKVTRLGTILRQASLAAWKDRSTWDLAQEGFSATFPLTNEATYKLFLSSFELIEGRLPTEGGAVLMQSIVDFCRAFLCDLSFKSRRLTTPTESQEVAVLETLLRTAKQNSTIDEMGDYLTAVRAVCQRVYGMRFCEISLPLQVQSEDALTMGAMCWAPKEAQVGDTVAVIHGFRIPMLLRRVPGAEERYRFLGICYVHDFMDGQALRTTSLHSESIVVA